MLACPADQGKRLELIRHAVRTLEAQPGVAVYIDAGHSSWVPAPEMAERLKLAGIAEARGFALNTSNYRATTSCSDIGKELIAALGSIRTSSSTRVATAMARRRRARRIGATRTAAPSAARPRRTRANPRSMRSCG